MRNLTPSALQEYLETADPAPLLLDVREPWEYQRVHLSDSQLVPMRQIPAASQSMESDEEIVVICHHGVRSRQVAMFLESRGFRRVINLQGGIDAWARDLDPSMPTY
ncbi:MAG: rhodanese-like domain-containing protein [Pseudomonadota bacterium]|nr:rhodanese-like domain-containing protein [Pseudomonadota bacterium]